MGPRMASGSSDVVWPKAAPERSSEASPMRSLTPIMNYSGQDQLLVSYEAFVRQKDIQAQMLNRREAATSKAAMTYSYVFPD